MPHWLPSDDEIAALESRARSAGTTLRDNVLFSLLYHHKNGLYPRRGKKALWEQDPQTGEWTRLKRTLSRREWIEQFFPVRTLTGAIVRLKLNPTQRRMECWILRMERAGVPTRMIILKARKMGISTYVQAVMFEMNLRGEHMRGLIVADNGDRAALLLQIANVARTQMERERMSDGRSVPWNFRLPSKATYSMVWDRPMYCEVKITSAETDNPGRGMTPSIVHLSETAFWQDAAKAQASVMSGLPSLPGTMAFDESTANGASGKYHDDFWRAWRTRDEPLRERTELWQAVFFAWFEDPNYHWTKSYGLGRELTHKMEVDIQMSLTDEERWLLKQTYTRRWSPSDEWEHKIVWDIWELVIENGKIVGTKETYKAGRRVWRRKGVGKQPVTLDQLAWRRAKIVDKECAGNLDIFNREYPSRPEVAFLATGRPVFDPNVMELLSKNVGEIKPLFTGFLRRREIESDYPTFERHLEPHARGSLLIWGTPEAGKQYIIASDTAGGGSRDDHAVAIVIDAETCHIVAGMRERAAPHIWGPRCADLGHYYNKGVLAFETFPSTHGLAAATEAKNEGYPNLYMRRRHDSWARQQTDVLGFHTNVETKPLLISRIKKQIEVRFDVTPVVVPYVPWSDLLHEMRQQQWDDNERMVSKGHDDMVVCYGIALMVRDDCLYRGIVKTPERAPMTESERYWAKEDKRMATRVRIQKRMVYPWLR